MGLKQFSVTLEEELVNRAKNKIENSGGKLSPVLNNLLKEWLGEKNIKKNIKEKKPIKSPTPIQSQPIQKKDWRDEFRNAGKESKKFISSVEEELKGEEDLL